MDDITAQRYRPCPGGVIDSRSPQRRVGFTSVPVAHYRPEYTTGEILNLVHWLNDREAGYYRGLNTTRPGCILCAPSHKGAHHADDARISPRTSPQILPRWRPRLRSRPGPR